ncbi:MarR family winged helix-turn-helix transcriptional regulator [Deinococcus aestuarii]|uniref:MarR family winged helix-turn-helix transcriptional regulator n=1 Tax=Deinococcus aestuarii TaxID=2774531 RepID=UPI001C0BD3F7|nr:MarR family transcriptional regulator [Deinococcus aestuarii]
MTQTPDPPIHDLDTMLCFNLYVASRSMVMAYRPLLDPLGLTYPQYLVMLALWNAPHPPTVKALGEWLHLDSGTLSPLLKRLEAAGHLRRHRRASDERELEVTLTEQGRALREQARDIPRLIGERVGLGDRQVRDLIGLLRQVIVNLDEGG